MKKLIIAGSSKLHERALYWRGYFEGRGYEVIDWPSPVSTDNENLDEPQIEPGLSRGHWLNPSDSDYAARLTKIYKRFYKNLDQADVFFLMNEDKDDIEGYIGASAIAELTYVVTGNLNRGHKTEIYINKLPSKTQNCYDEVKFWLDQGWIHIFKRPAGRKALFPLSNSTTTSPYTNQDSNSILTEKEPDSNEPEPLPTTSTEPATTEPAPARRSSFFGNSDQKIIDITTYKKSCLKPLTPTVREYLKILCPEFPAWLLRYIVAPEFQRLSEVSMTTMDYNAIYNFQNFNSVFQHSIGVALIIWNFTKDKKQTLAGLFHDIASPAFKHSIDYMNGDSEAQESIERDTGKIIRNSKVITKQLKRDGILPSEVSDYHLYPIADNDIPGLAADRLEYTFSNGYLLYNTWTLNQIKTFYSDLTIVKNESDLDEIAFHTPEIATEFALSNLELSANYHSDKARATLQFIADVISSMVNSGYLTMDDLYVMSEREIIDWILSCGDKTIGDAFRQFQHATSVYSGNTSKKSTWSTNAKAKIRYITPLVESSDSKTAPAKRINKLNKSVASSIDQYLADKQPKYVGFDFDFTPYAIE